MDKKIACGAFSHSWSRFFILLILVYIHTHNHELLVVFASAQEGTCRQFGEPSR